VMCWFLQNIGYVSDAGTFSSAIDGSLV